MVNLVPFQESSTYPYRAVITQVNEPKEYRRGRLFFVRGKFTCGATMLAMFAASHIGKFSVGDEIGFTGSMSTSERGTWYAIGERDEVVVIPGNGFGDFPIERRMFDVTYCGWPKEREGREASSFCYVDGDWLLEIPVSAMEDYFSTKLRKGVVGEAEENIGPGYYGLLGVSRMATTVEIKRAWRRIVRELHPDVSDAPDAAERFRKINEAYQVLCDQDKRQQYDSWLALTDRESIATPPGLTFSIQRVYNPPPLRCGLVTVDAIDIGGRFVARSIVDWQVEKKRVTASCSLEIGLLDAGTWGITVKAMMVPDMCPIEIDIEADKLPFGPAPRLKKRVDELSGHLLIEVVVQRGVRWASPQPVVQWDVLDVLNVALDEEASRTIEKALEIRRCNDDEALVNGNVGNKK